jgi:hypothetical protein
MSLSEGEGKRRERREENRVRTRVKTCCSQREVADPNT